MRKRSAAFLVAGVCTVISVFIPFYSSIKASPVKTWDVRVARVRNQDIASSVSSTGVLEEKVRRDVFPEQPLKVRKLYIKKGDKVNSGDKLLEYDVEQLKLQYNELLSAKNIQELITDKARKAVDFINDTNNPLGAYSGYGIKDIRPDSAVLPQVGVRSSTQSELEMQEENLRSVNRRLSSAAAVLNKVEESTLAPIPGIVSAINVTEGGYSTVQMPAVTIVQTENLIARLNVKEISINGIRKGQNVEITGDAIPEVSVVKGSVEEISPVAVKTRSLTGEETYIEVVVAIKGTTDRLIPGINVNCRIMTASRKKVPVLDYMCIREDKDGKKGVYVVDDRGRIELRSVVLGVTSDMNVEIAQGLSEGEQVIINWQPAFKHGDKAHITEES